MPDDLFLRAVLSPTPPPLAVVPAGIRRKYGAALLRDLLLHARGWREDVGFFFSGAADVYRERGDAMPAIYQALSYWHVLAHRLRHGRPLRHGTGLVAAYFDGITWNGDPIP
jgi:hypothetical protein